jgi:hypothetical protein
MIIFVGMFVRTFQHLTDIPDLVLQYIQVRKRPLNRKELSRKEEDAVTVHDLSSLTVYEPKLKVSTVHLREILLCFHYSFFDFFVMYAFVVYCLPSHENQFFS